MEPGDGLRPASQGLPLSAFQSVDEILERKRGSDRFRYLLEKFASFFVISGVQPKVLVRDENAFADMEQNGQRLSQG